ncbi:MAG TPA: hypothetical protein VKQ71_11680 [Acidimicrobiales bacterium]|nr:hypothetical protein [Acidimicrobiales bacterium]
MPAVAIVTGSFEDLAYRMAEHNKHPKLNVLVLPYPLEERPEDEVRDVARQFYPKLLSMLGATRD